MKICFLSPKCLNGCFHNRLRYVLFHKLTSQKMGVAALMRNFMNKAERIFIFQMFRSVGDYTQGR